MFTFFLRKLEIHEITDYSHEDAILDTDTVREMVILEKTESGGEFRIK